MVALVVEAAGSPGRCCLCGRRASRALCLRCRAAHTDPAGQLAPWLRALQREAQRLAWRERAAWGLGVHVESLTSLLDELDAGEYVVYLGALRRAIAVPPPDISRPSDEGETPPEPGPRRRAPRLADHLGRDWATAGVARLRRSSASGVPLDMPAFLALLRAEFGWPPPGTTADRGHREELVDLYERVYPA